MIRLAANQDQLAFILGHECGHIVLNTDDEYAADAFSLRQLKKNRFNVHKGIQIFDVLANQPFEQPGPSGNQQQYPSMKERYLNVQSLTGKFKE